MVVFVFLFIIAKEAIKDVNIKYDSIHLMWKITCLIFNEFFNVWRNVHYKKNYLVLSSYTTIALPKNIISSTVLWKFLDRYRYFDTR